MKTTYLWKSLSGDVNSLERIRTREGDVVWANSHHSSIFPVHIGGPSWHVLEIYSCNSPQVAEACHDGPRNILQVRSAFGAKQLEATNEDDRPKKGHDEGHGVS